jgi:hypothetical protein
VLALEHPAADRADQQRRLGLLTALQTRIRKGFAGRGQRDPVRPRASPRRAEVLLTEAGISAAMRERKPAVSMMVIGLIVQVPAASPDQKRVTPAPYGLTTPSPLTTTSRQPPWARPAHAVFAAVGPVSTAQSCRVFSRKGFARPRSRPRPTIPPSPGLSQAPWRASGEACDRPRPAGLREAAERVIALRTT